MSLTVTNQSPSLSPGASQQPEVTAWNASLAKEEKSSSSGTGDASGTAAKETVNSAEMHQTYGIPPYDGEGLMDLKVDGDKTVATQASEDFVQGMRDDLKSGKIDAKSDEAKLLKLIDAQGAMENGYDLYGYIENRESGGKTYRLSQDYPTHLEPNDVKDIIDKDKIATQFNELMGKQSISTRYDDAMKRAIESAPRDQVEALKAKTIGTLFDGDKPNTKFEYYAIAVEKKASAIEDEAAKDKLERELSNYFETLKYFEPDKYATRKQTFDQNMMSADLDRYVGHIETVDPENIAIGLRTTIDVIQSSVNGVLQTADKGSKIYTEAMDYNNASKSFQDLAKTLKPDEMAKLGIAADAIAEAIDQKNIPADQAYAKYNEAANQIFADQLKYSPNNVKEAYRSFLDVSVKAGTFGALSGVMSLVSGGSQLSHGKWGTMTSDERVAAVRDLVGGLSFASDFAKFGETTISILKKGSDASSSAASWLGLFDNNFPDIWKNSPNAGSEFARALNQKVTETVNTASERLQKKATELDLTGLNESELSDAERQEIRNAASKVGTMMGAPVGSIAEKAGRTFFRFMVGAGLDITGGVMDLVTGIRAIKKADNALQRAGAGVQVAGGLTTIGLGLSSTIKMLAPRGSVLATRLAVPAATRVFNGFILGTQVVGPMFGAATAIFGMVGVLITELINHGKKQKLTDSQGEFFKSLADQGVARNDWGDKLEYARYATYMYGGRDTPKNTSIYEFQKAEWEHFRDTPSKQGSSINRIAPELHKDSDFGTLNLYEKFLTGETARESAKDVETHTADWRPWIDTDLNINSLPHSVDEMRLNNVTRVYDKAFYTANKIAIDTMAHKFNDWAGQDHLLSKSELDDIAADANRDDTERQAANFLLEKTDFRNALDTIQPSGAKGDSKISEKDLNLWLARVADGTKA
ncbi:hypothetical protein [Methylobacterium sp. J-076]|uniref:hypothetical protein n=1 Tax=Methylobacterium sp. J-076 TaxID=2836655 RepID=UPI001FB928C5|nr:hypothetical protein [Methylobacterium sp. J-076]MCJ2012969.1 hypothetical protein [Methylobacterium sp. J-076]